MAGDKGKKPGKSGAARPPVIDVQASKVQDGKQAGKGAAGSAASKAAADQAGGDASAANATKPARSASAAGSKAGGQAKTTATDKGKAQKPAEKTVRKDTTATPAQDKPQEEKPKGKKSDKGSRGDKSRKGGGFAKLLLGLLALGAAAGGGAWLYQQYGPDRKLTAMQQRIAMLERKIAAASPASDVKALKDEVARLQTAQQKLAAGLRELSKSDGGELPLQVKALDERLDKLERLLPDLHTSAERTAELEQTLQQLQQQMSTLKQGLEELASRPATSAEGQGEGTSGSAAAAGAGAVASAAALVALKLSVQELQQKTAALNEQLAQVRTAADPARMQALEARMSKAEQALMRAQEELRTLAQQAKVHAEQAAEQAQAAIKAVEELRANPPMPKFTPPPQTTAYAALRGKVMTGQPFKAELDALAALLPASTALDALRPFAEQGVATTAALAARLKKLRQDLQKAQQQAAAPAPDDPLATLKGKLLQVVKVRRAGTVDWPQTLAGVEAKIATGGLAAAVAELQPLQQKMPAALKDWLAQARARLKVNAALDVLADEVLQHNTQGTATAE